MTGMSARLRFQDQIHGTNEWKRPGRSGGGTDLV